MTEGDIRETLVAELSRLPEGKDAAFIAEMFVDGFARRADLIMANGLLSAFEIKSPQDSLMRLEGQLDTYVQYFEQVTVVCAAKHAPDVMACAPRSVGIWSVSDRGEFNVVRLARKRTIIKKNSWLSFLPVDELTKLLKISRIKMCGNDRASLIAAAKDVPLLTIREFVLAYLKRRSIRVAALEDARRKRQENTALLREKERIRFENILLVEPAIRAIPRKIA